MKNGLKVIFGHLKQAIRPKTEEQTQTGFFIIIFFFPPHTQELSLGKWWFSKTKKTLWERVGFSKEVSQVRQSFLKRAWMYIVGTSSSVIHVREILPQMQRDAEILPQHQKTGQGPGERDSTVLLLVSPIWFILPPKSSLAFKKKDEFGSILGLRTAGLLL